VGIGTTTPFSKLSVNSNLFGISQTNGTVTLSTYLSFGAGWFGTYTDHPLHFYTNNSEAQMTLNQAGQLGIGTTTPLGGYRLDISGPVRSFDNTTHFVAQTTGGTNSWARYYMRSNAQSWFMGTSQNFNGNQLYIGDETFNQTRFSIQPNGGPINMQGNLTQDESSNGLPKAMVYLNGDGTILRCYNGLTGTNTGGCGISATKVNTGFYDIYFPFPISTRYFSIAVENHLPVPVIVNYYK